jgi:hypothetical protein
MTLADGPERALPDEPSPDSGNLRVSSKTAFESGIPPARDRLARRSSEADAAIEQLELVMVESTRAEANLGLLLRGLKHLSNGAESAREANAVLVQELESLRSRVAKVYEREAVLELRTHSLENALDAAARERESWLVQEDAFLAQLLDEHEQKLFELERHHERQLGELDLALEELRTQRDSARTEVNRLIYERDTALALLNEPLASTERTPSTLAPGLGAPRSPLGSVKLTKPPLKSKPDASTRPLVGYSMSAEDVLEEHLETRATSRPPKP